MDEGWGRVRVSPVVVDSVSWLLLWLWLWLWGERESDRCCRLTGIEDEPVDLVEELAGNGIDVDDAEVVEVFEVFFS